MTAGLSGPCCVRRFGVGAGGDYLEVVDPAGAHAFRWYHNSNGSSPTAIPLTAGQAVTGINETLPAYP